MSRRVGYRQWASLLAIALFLSACGSRSPATVPQAAQSPITEIERSEATPVLAATLPPATVPPATAPGRATPPREGEPAHGFALRDLDGHSVSLDDYRGQHVLINFWASWCGPCLLEIPHMVALYEERRDQGFVILAVNVLEDRQQVAAFADKHAMTFPVLLDTRGTVTADYFVRGIPVSVFVDAEGVVRTVHVGILTEKVLAERVDELMR